MADFIHTVAEVGRRADVSDDDKQQLKQAAERLGNLFHIVADMAHEHTEAAPLLEQMTASLERLNEELARGNALLEKIATRS